jgi:pimeloyl-ACP methyl ester carboxylesterase
VGWYEGGAIAANFAATYPSRVRALVIGSFTARQHTTKASLGASTRP